MTAGRCVWAAAVALCAYAGPAAAADGLSVGPAWSRAAPITTIPAVVYLTVTDYGAPDVLLGAASPIAQSATLHQSHMVNGLMVMDPVRTLPVEPGRPIILAPGGYHIMLEGLRRPLAQGETFPLTLTFAHAGPVSVTVTVEPMTYMPPADPAGSTMAGMKM